MQRELNFNIFNTQQKELFPKLNFMSKDFYLSGGTALALYLNHRTSLDFDIFSRKEFKQAEITNYIKENLEKTSKIEITTVRNNTFIAVVDGVNLSIFYYNYELLEPLYKKLGYISLASLEDASAMKVVALVQRPAIRDYIDIYFILKTLSVENLIALSSKKYPSFSKNLFLRALTYFEDVENERLESRGIRMMDKSFSWNKAKKEIFEKVKAYQLSMLK